MSDGPAYSPLLAVAEVDLADPAPWPEAAVWLCWRGDVPLGAMERAGRHVLPVAAPLPRRPLPKMTAAVCTRDRPRQLRHCLDALARQRRPLAEILVVDNGSDPETRHTAERAGARCVREPRPGVQWARRRALREARGEVIAFVDDDCLPVSGWSGALAHAFAAEPGAACCTGPVIPTEVETEAQRLMERRGGFSKGFERRCFSHASHAHRWRHFPLQGWMFGTGGNMAFRRDALLAAGGFAPELARAEDLDAFFRILRDGHTLVYEPCALVTHEHVRDYATLRRRLFRWGYGYTAYLTRVVAAEPGYRRRAVGELAGFVGYQARGRWWPALRGRGDLPLDLVTAEFLGALAGIPGYWWDRLREGWGDHEPHAGMLPR